MGNLARDVLRATLYFLSANCAIRSKARAHYIAPDKAAYCVFTQFRERENAIKFISVRTKTQ